jgi:hypothetical protein
MRHPHDPQRDAEVEAWNDAVRSGDPDRIEAAKVSTLTAIHKRIMDDDPNYRQAGWSPDAA